MSESSLSAIEEELKKLSERPKTRDTLKNIDSLERKYISEVSRRAELNPSEIKVLTERQEKYRRYSSDLRKLTESVVKSVNDSLQGGSSRGEAAQKDEKMSEVEELKRQMEVMRTQNEQLQREADQLRQQRLPAEQQNEVSIQAIQNQIMALQNRLLFPPEQQARNNFDLRLASGIAPLSKTTLYAVDRFLKEIKFYYDTLSAEGQIQLIKYIKACKIEGQAAIKTGDFSGVTFNDLEDIVRRRVLTTELSGQLQQRIMSSFQGKHSLQEYVEFLKDLGTRYARSLAGTPEELEGTRKIVEKMVLNQFIMGCHYVVKPVVVAARPNTIEEALQVALASNMDRGHFKQKKQHNNFHQNGFQASQRRVTFKEPFHEFQQSDNRYVHQQRQQQQQQPFRQYQSSQRSGSHLNNNGSTAQAKSWRRK